MRKSSVLSFEALMDLWRRSRADVSAFELLGLTVPGGTGLEQRVPLETLYERFRGTWWQVVWPHYPGRRVLTRGVQCKYLADSFRDALRRSPQSDYSLVEESAILRDDPSDDEPGETHGLPNRLGRLHRCADPV